MKENKYITDELIEERMKAKGFGEKDSHDEDHVRKIVLKSYDSSLSTDWLENMDLYQYEESTSDGYTVYISTHNTKNIAINEDVNHYVSSLQEDLEQAIVDGSEIYVDDLYQDYIDCAVQDLYTNLYEVKEKQVYDELFDEGYCEEPDTTNINGINDLLNLLANND